jgi:hypothetical protein
MKNVFQKVIDSRLKLRPLGNPSDLSQDRSPQRYVAYFVDAEAQQSKTAPNQSGRVSGKFDIRVGSKFDLLVPEKEMRPPTDFVPQERIIAQLEKEPDLIFDVNEVLNPFQLILRIKTYDKNTLKVLSVSEVNEK